MTENNSMEIVRNAFNDAVHSGTTATISLDEMMHTCSKNKGVITRFKENVKALFQVMMLKLGQLRKQ